MAPEDGFEGEEYREFEEYVRSNLREADKERGVDYMTELSEDPSALQTKLSQLVAWVQDAKHWVVYTGAGISTASGLPDYRGPQGVWTKRVQQQQRQERKDRAEEGEEEWFSQRLSQVEPSFSHKALAALCQARTRDGGALLKHVISTNVDGLHVKSGLQRGNNLSELHGNAFVEECSRCSAQFYRSFPVRTARALKQHETGRVCELCFPPSTKEEQQAEAEATLRDIIVNFGNTYLDVPSMEAEHDRAWVQCIKADLVLVLGSSLSVPTACDLVDACVERGGRLVIVNRQRTPKDPLAAMLIHTSCDVVMHRIVEALNVSV